MRNAFQSYGWKGLFVIGLDLIQARLFFPIGAIEPVTIGKRAIIRKMPTVTRNLSSYSIVAVSLVRVIKNYSFQAHQWEQV